MFESSTGLFARYFVGSGGCTCKRRDDHSAGEWILRLRFAAREINTELEVELIAPHTTGAAIAEQMEGGAVTRFHYWWPKWQTVADQGCMTWRIRENSLRLVQLLIFLRIADLDNDRLRSTFFRSRALSERNKFFVIVTTYPRN